ncbi:acyl-CoA synthetase short-chain family member 3, mitochondrial-like [Styela clava]
MSASSVAIRRTGIAIRPKLTAKTYSTAYHEAHKKSLDCREEFWAEAAEDLTWFKKWNKVIDHTNPPFTKWFLGGEINHCYNAVDRHVEKGRGSQPAIIHDSPVTKSVSKMTYSELLDQVSRLAGVLSKLGVKKGDRVMIYMPMIPQAIISMMATVRLGGIHVVVFGGFAGKELSVRINSCKPKVIICANYGIEPTRLVSYKPMVDQAIEMAEHKPLKTIVFQRPNLDPVTLNNNTDVDWNEQISSARPHDCVPVESNHPMYLLYTSGTTGLPKAAVRPTAGHSVVLNWSMQNIYGVKPGEIFWTAADIGWAVGHSYACHGPLLHCNTTVIYEGKPVGTPDASSFFRIINDHKVSCLFTAPTALRVIKREDPKATASSKYDMSSLRTLFVAGEHCDIDTAQWAMKAFKSPVLDHWWQTETGHPITASCVGLGNSLEPPSGSTGVPVPGWDVQVVDEDGVPVEPGQLGNIVVRLPLNLGTFQTIWEDDDSYVDTYFKKYPGYYDTMDAGVKDEKGYVSVMSRTDDVINVAGHRLSCGHIEEAICSHKDVVEAAVVAKDDEIKGSTPFAYIILKPGCSVEKNQIFQEIVQLVRQQIGPVAAFKEGIFVNRLPKTRSGKTPRKTLESLVNKKPYKVSPTIEDETVYPELEQLLKNEMMES